MNNRITGYELDSFIDKIYTLLKYDSFTVKQLESNININPRRMSCMLSKATFNGLCLLVNRHKLPYKYKNTTLYRRVNKYKISKSKYIPKSYS